MRTAWFSFLCVLGCASQRHQATASNRTGFYFSRDDVFFKNGSLTQDEDPPQHLSKLSLQEKCDRGGPISVAWQYYGPYSMHEAQPDNFTVEVQGIFPHLLSRMLDECCAKNVTVKFGKVLGSIRELEAEMEQAGTVYDLTFPLTGTNLETNVLKDYPYIAIVQAPRVALLVGEKTETNMQTSQLLKTVLKAWPILIFIIVAATLSGIIIWLLDRLKNPDEFPRPFIRGTWEGFWWAFVTMTTVGYGDRAPKSFLARIFCIVWILVGIIIIAIFTAIITASLSASIQHHFIVHGSRIGAYDGSTEYRLGVSLNAEMQAYTDIDQMNRDLVGGTLRGSLIDNYVLTSYSEFVMESNVRIEMTYDHPVTYGVALRTTNSSRMLKCFVRYMDHHPQEVFEVIAKYLEPLRNPTDDVSQEVKASEDLLFFREPAFMKVLYILLGIVGFLLLVGMSWEFLYNRPRRRKRDKKSQSSQLIPLSQSKCDCHEMLLGQQTIQNIHQKFSRMKQLAQEYEEFYDSWLDKVRTLEEEGGANAPRKV